MMGIKNVKSSGKKVLASIKSALGPNKTIEEIHEYWKRPGDEANSPEKYLGKKESQITRESLNKFSRTPVNMR